MASSLRAVGSSGVPCILAAACIAGLFACSGGAPERSQTQATPAPPPVAPIVPAPDRRSVPDTSIAREFLAVAEQLESESEFLGSAPMRRLEERLSSGSIRLSERLQAQTELVVLLAQHGRLDEAEALAASVLRQVEEMPGVLELSPRLLRLPAIVQLRRAEVENCIRRHDRDCCLFPLAGGGVHRERGPAERARELYLRNLALDPQDLTARWLLNVTAMALGEHPAQVPPEFLIPPEAFASAHDPGRFVDVAPELGVDRLSLCGGVVAEDFDGDGWIDLVTTSSDARSCATYFRNTGAGGFEDRTLGSGLEDQLGGLNLIGGDYDSDGDVDLYILRGAWLYEDGRVRNSLLRNDGHGRFTDVTREAGLAEPAEPSQAATWADFDNDGHLDLFVGVESLIEFHAHGVDLDHSGEYRAHLYRNRGDGTFEDIAAAAGVDSGKYCKGVCAGDYDNDGDVDLYLSAVGANQLFRNEGDGSFVEVAAELGVAEPRSRSFACWFFDHDNDGWLDLFVGGYSAQLEAIAAESLGQRAPGVRPRLYANLGGRFEDRTIAAGLDRLFLPMGANFGDFDEDGHLDIYLATGEPNLETLVPNVALWNDGGGRFLDATTAAGLGHLQKGHGVAFADFDHDGDQDIFNQLGGFYPADVFHDALFRNPGHGRSFLHVKLVGTQSARQGHGARLRVVFRDSDGERQVHRAAGSVSSFGGSPMRQEIGLSDAASVDLLEVRWPASGLVQRFINLPVNRLITVTEGQDELDIQELNPTRLGAPP